MTDIVKIQEEITKQIANKEVFGALVNTTFKDLDQALVKRALMEGLMRGFKFEDFLEKNIYAIPFTNRTTGVQTYSLVTSVDYARKLGMKGGVVGKSAPLYVENDKGEIVSCSITIKKKLGETIGDFTSLVYFKEYNTGKQLWNTKPRTMIAKVAEMHALRMACPDELSQSYIEEETEKDVEVTAVVIDVTDHKKKLEAVTNLDELKKVWASLPIQAKNELKDLKETLKAKFDKKSKKDEDTEVRD